MSQPSPSSSVNSPVNYDPVTTTSTNQTMLPPCRICSEKASGFHYGVNTCEACKGFFRRCLQKSMSTECTNEGKCNANAGKRNVCASCRYKTCVSVGMSKSAIKTGRYTHEKKTSNIREVKRLEAKEKARNPVAGSPTSILSAQLANSSVVLTPEPMDVCNDTKTQSAPLSKTNEPVPRNEHYETIIEHILTAYREQTMHTMDFFSSLKEKEQEYLKEKKLYTEVFGSMKPVTAEEYIKIYQATGLDIDGRRELIKSMIPRIESGMRRCIMFIKQLPGFRDLPVEDQISLIKISRKEMWTILYHKAFNIEMDMVTLFWGDCIDRETLGSLHGTEYIDSVFKVSRNLQKLQLSQPETVIFAALSLFFTDKCELLNPEMVESSQQLLLDTFTYQLARAASTAGDTPSKGHRRRSLLARALLILPDMRSLNDQLRRAGDHFQNTWSHCFHYPPLFHELIFLGQQDSSLLLTDADVDMHVDSPST